MDIQPIGEHQHWHAVDAALSQFCRTVRTWLPLLVALMTALDGWLVLGPLTQSTLLATAVVRRVGGTIGAALRRASDTLVVLPGPSGHVAIAADEKQVTIHE